LTANFQVALYDIVNRPVSIIANRAVYLFVSRFFIVEPGGHEAFDDDNLSGRIRRRFLPPQSDDSLCGLLPSDSTPQWTPLLLTSGW